MYMSTSARQIGYREKRDALWEENKRLKMTIAIYECDNNIAALNDFYEKKIRGIEAREKRK